MSQCALSKWRYGKGVVLDMRHKRDGEAITADEVWEAKAKISYTRTPMDIVSAHDG